MAAIALRPRSATEIVDVSVQILRHNYGALVTLSVAAMLPLAAMTLVSGAARAPGGGLPVASFNALTIFASFASLIFYFIAQNAVMVGASQAYLGEPVRGGVAFARAVRRVALLILLSILLYIGFFLGLLLFIFPGIYLALRWAPLPMVTVLEDGDAGATLTRVWRLSRDNAVHIFVVMLVLLFLYFGIAAIMIFLLSSTMLLGAAAAKAGSILYYAILALFFPFFQMVLVALYYDLRIREEGLDVELMSKELGAVEPAV